MKFLLITLSLITFNSYAACDNVDIQAGDGINKLVTEGCSVSDPAQRDIILNQQIKGKVGNEDGEQIQSDSLNLKFAALDAAIESITNTPIDTTGYEWQEINNGLDLQTFINDYFPLNYTSGNRFVSSTNTESIRNQTYNESPPLRSDVSSITFAENQRYGYVRFVNGTCNITIYGKEVGNPTRVLFPSVRVFSSGSQNLSLTECREFATVIKSTTEIENIPNSDVIFY